MSRTKAYLTKDKAQIWYCLVGKGELRKGHYIYYMMLPRLYHL